MLADNFGELPREAQADSFAGVFRNGLQRHETASTLERANAGRLDGGRASIEAPDGWFREITPKRLRRGTFRSVRELIEAIVEYVEAHNEQAHGMF